MPALCNQALYYLNFIFFQFYFLIALLSSYIYITRRIAQVKLLCRMKEVDVKQKTLWGQCDSIMKPHAFFALGRKIISMVL